MTLRIKSRLLAIGTLIVRLCWLGVAQESTSAEALPLNSIIEAIEKTQSGVRHIKCFVNTACSVRTVQALIPTW
jgi:hypothetical protein